ncbi:MAG: class I SAM-dependent methyltransferase, partial [Syntrophales bacterium]|nr:class I SAM-dependent methyltransferase [Syntrophales bacterium]
MDQRSRIDDKEQGRYAHFGYREVPSEEKATQVSRHFSAIAKRYDLTNTIMSVGMHHGWKRQAVCMLNPQDGDRVIDLCGGTGDLALLSSPMVGDHGYVILYDINQEMMLAGRQKVKHSPAGNRVFYVQGDSERISFPDETFDAAMVGFGIRNLTDMKKGLSEVYRILKPDSKMVCLEFSLPTAAWFRMLYDLYSFTVIPLIGRFLTGSPDTSRYLPESIRTFPIQKELSSIMREVGYR